MSTMHTARRKARAPRRPRAPRAPAPRPPASPDLDLANINLNLAVALDALLTEGNVTRAAARVGITQSAMSHALRQLRELLGDALLIRGRGGMVRTPRAEQLAAPLHRGLLEVQRALRNESVFDPAASSRRFILATTDYFASALLPSLLELMDTEAPQVDLVVRPLVIPQIEAHLESGELDLVVGAYPEPSPVLRQQKLFTEDNLGDAVSGSSLSLTPCYYKGTSQDFGLTLRGRVSGVTPASRICRTGRRTNGRAFAAIRTSSTLTA